MPRRKPFSNKQKKKQLQVKRERKRGDTGSGQSSRNASVERAVRRDRQSDTSDSETTDIRRINHQPGTRDGRYDPNRSPTYKLCVTAAVTGWIPRLLCSSSACTVPVGKANPWCSPSYRVASVPAVREEIWPNAKCFWRD